MITRILKVAALGLFLSPMMVSAAPNDDRVDACLDASATYEVPYISSDTDITADPYLYSSADYEVPYDAPDTSITADACLDASSGHEVPVSTPHASASVDACVDATEPVRPVMSLALTR